MLRLTRPVVMMALAMILTTGIAAQKNSTFHKQQGDYSFGLNGGVAYQQSDVATDLSGLGFGLTYGKNLIYSPNAPFSVDVRSRFQIARTFGKDIRPTLGIENNDALNGTKTLDYTGEAGNDLVYANHKTNMAEIGLEGVITLNGLREATGLGLSFTGGVGLDWYKTTIDQRDADGLYTDQYNLVDAGGAKPYNLSQLDGFRDGKYETVADGFGRAGKFGIMPSLGIELDYDLTDNIAIGVGHRMTFSGTDLLDGQRWTDANTLTGDNDRLHYTSLGLKYTFNQNKANKTHQNPRIELIEPYGSGLKTNKAIIPIKAIVNRVDNPFDVYLTVNGEEQQFNFNKPTLAGRIRLQPGENRIVITASNRSGNTKETIFITYEDDQTASTNVIEFGMPEISFTNPAYDDAKVEQHQFNIRAKVRLVETKKDIILWVNGKKERFDFDADIAILEATVDLQSGNNTIEIQAKNRNGEQRATRTIFRELPLPFPTATFTSPAYNNATVEQGIATIKIKLTHIAQSTDIQLLINGQNEPNFFFDYQTGQLKADLQLREGANEIIVTAQNIRGEVRDQRTIIYQRPYVPVPVIRSPRVTINAPQYNQSTTREEIVTIHASLENIYRKSDIRFSNNGLTIYDFDYNPSTGILKHRLYLRPGINQVLIEAQNEVGQDGASATINFEIPLPPPIILPVAPRVEIYQPRRNDVFEDEEIVVKANLSGVLDKRDIEFRVNREDCIDFRFNPSTGKFRAKIRLQEGENVIAIKTTNPGGTDRQRVIVFHERRYAPIIDFKNSNFAKTEKEEIQIKGKVEYVENKRDIELLINNRPIREFRFRNNKLEANLLLSTGKNEIEIIAKNQYGEDSKRWTVIFAPPQAPIVAFRAIRNNQTFKKEKIKLEAIVKHVPSKRNIRLFVNGIGVRSFDWETEKLTATIRLKEGKNAISLKASSDYGNTEENLQLNYSIPKAPSINFISHRQEETVKDNSITLKVKLKNVANREAISLTVNNKNAAFRFREEVLKSPLKLQKGKNTIRLKADTEDGTVEKKLTIYYEPTIAKPTVRFLNSNKLKNSTQQMTTKVTALVENIRNKSELELEVNGKSFDDFDFDRDNGKVNATIPLERGLNVILLRAENESGMQEAKTTITRRTGRPVISKSGGVNKSSKVSVVKVKTKKSKF